MLMNVHIAKCIANAESGVSNSEGMEYESTNAINFMILKLRKILTTDSVQQLVKKRGRRLNC